MNTSANAYDEATLAVKLDTHREASVEHYANTCGKATLAVKLDAHGEAGVWTPCHARGEAKFGQV